MQSCHIWLIFGVILNIGEDLPNLTIFLFLRHFKCFQALLYPFSIHTSGSNGKTPLCIVDRFGKLIGLCDLAHGQQFINDNSLNQFKFLEVIAKGLQSTFIELMTADELYGLLLLAIIPFRKLANRLRILLKIQANSLPKPYLIVNRLQPLDIGYVLLGILLRASGRHRRQLQVIRHQRGLINNIRINQPADILQYLLRVQSLNALLLVGISLIYV